MRVACLVNFGSGSHRGRKLAERLRDSCSDFLDVMEVSWGRLFPCIDEARQYRRIVIAGGDGTVSNLIPHFYDGEFQIGVFPIGTGNDLARELQIHKLASVHEPEPLIRHYRESRSKSFTVWRARFGGRERLFLNYLSFGFDARVVDFFSHFRKRNPWIGRRFGVYGNRAVYGVGGIMSLPTPRLKDISVRCRQGEGEWKSWSVDAACSLFFSNIQSVMGLGRSHPSSDPSDNTLELTVMQWVPDYFGFISRELSPWKPLYSEEGLEWEISNLPEDCMLQADGDSLGALDGDTIHVEYAGSVNFCLPSKNGHVLS